MVSGYKISSFDDIVDQINHGGFHPFQNILGNFQEDVFLLLSSYKRRFGSVTHLTYVLVVPDAVVTTVVDWV